MNTTQAENIFINELQGLLALGSQQFKKLRTEGIDEKSLREVFYVIHNVKGLAAFLGNKEITDLSHKLESFLLGINKKIEHKSSQRIVKLVSSYEDILNHICVSEMDSKIVIKQIKNLSSRIQKETSSKKSLRLLDWSFDFGNLERNKKNSTKKRNVLELTSLLENGSSKFRENVNLISNLQSIEIEETSFNILKKSLVHIIQNIFDHGFVNGSNLINKVVITASLERGSLILEIKDNGAGFDLSKIQKVALEKNLISKESKLSEKEILDLVFNEGFSTMEVASETSGRGIGMSIVKTDLEALGGSVEVATREGFGSEFRLKIPLTRKVGCLQSDDAAA